MRHLANLYQVTRNSIERNPGCGCNSPISAPLGSGIIRLCSYHEGMETGIDLDRNQEVIPIIKSMYEEEVIDENARTLLIKELERF